MEWLLEEVDGRADRIARQKEQRITSAPRIVGPELPQEEKKKKPEGDDTEAERV